MFRFVWLRVVTCCTVLHCVVLNACLLTHNGSGSCFHFCPRPCLNTCRWARLATHRHIGPHSVCIPCSHAHLGRATTACVSSPRDWAISTSSHMKQNIDTSTAPPHVGALRSLCLIAFMSENHDPKNWRSFPMKHSCHFWVLQRVFSAPPGATYHFRCWNQAHENLTKPEPVTFK